MNLMADFMSVCTNFICLIFQDDHNSTQMQTPTRFELYMYVLYAVNSYGVRSRNGVEACQTDMDCGVMVTLAV